MNGDDDLERWLSQHRTVVRQTLFKQDETVGDWHLLVFLGRGGSGEVWRARQCKTGQIAALKFLHRATSQASVRFLRECELFRRLQLPSTQIDQKDRHD